jgi:tol-pal system protein YbgF
MMVNRNGQSAVASAIALLLGACATGTSGDRVHRLEERVDRLETEGPPSHPDADSPAAREQAKRLDALEAKVVEASAPAQRAKEAQPGAGDRAAQQALAEELARVRERLDEQGRRLDAMDKTVARLQADSGERVAAPKSKEQRAARTPAGRTRAPTASAAAPAPAPAPVPVVAPGGEASGQAEVLALAREQEAKGERAVARDLYEEYARRYPSDPSTAEARFRLGELAYRDKRFQDAIVEFGRVAKDFSKSRQAPDALLRTADSMIAAGMKEEARTVLSDVPRRYPNSSAATRAKQRLAELGPATTP